MNRRSFLSCLGLASVASLTGNGYASLVASKTKSPKNIIFILSDDVGYGDVSCYGSTPGLSPALDRMAREGVQYMDAHSPAATCTPTRYACLTGEFAWRKPGRGIARGDAALVIPTNVNTLPKLLQRAGCVTGAVGKWHLGYGPGPGKTDWNADYISPGPREIGFDYSFLMPATGDRVPCIYVENQQTVNRDPNDPISVNYRKNYPGEPDGKIDRASLDMDWSHGHNMAVVNGIGRIGYMKGGEKARWDDYTMGDVLAERAVNFIETNKNKPFFLYFCPHDIHVPRCPHPRYQGKTGMGPRGDAMLQLDDQVKAVVDAVDRLGLAEDTLIIFSSDNGPVVDDGYKDQAAKLMGKHKPAGNFRGTKYSSLEGGHRVPCIARWKGNTPVGVKSNATFSLIDLCETFTQMKGVTLAPTDLPDSNALPTLFSDPNCPGNEILICQGGGINIRRDGWKYIVPRNVGDNPERHPKMDPLKGQLYHIATDPFEKKNCIKTHPEKAKALLAELLRIIKSKGIRRSMYAKT